MIQDLQAKVPQEFDDMTMIKYYSPQYQAWIMADLREELQDIYGSSASKIVYTVDGIITASIPVEKLAMRSASHKEHIKQRETAFERHTSNFKAIMEQCTPMERKQVSEYLTAGFKEMFRAEFNSDNLPIYPVIERIKKDLYSVELQQRRKRHNLDELEREEIARLKAKAIERKKLKAYRRGRAFERRWKNDNSSEQ